MGAHNPHQGSPRSQGGHDRCIGGSITWPPRSTRTTAAERA